MLLTARIAKVGAKVTKLDVQLIYCALRVFLCVSQIALSQENKLHVILSEAPAQSGTPCHSERRFIEVEESRSMS